MLTWKVYFKFVFIHLLVLGSRCSEINCGNSTHWSYVHDDIYHWDGYYDNYWFGQYHYYFKRYHDAYYCDVNDICTCAVGYKADTDGMECLQSMINFYLFFFFWKRKKYGFNFTKPTYVLYYESSTILFLWHGFYAIHLQ